MGTEHRMAANGNSNRNGADQGGQEAGQSGDAPDWANGLKQLYDDVVDEPIPDTFKDLLAKLDASDNDSGASGSEGQA